MTASSHSSPDSPRHRRYKPGLPVNLPPPTPPAAETSADASPTDSSPALSSLEQSRNDILAQLDERLAAAERLVSDLAGQIREMR